MGFWGGLFGGSNDQLNSDINQSGQVAGFGTSVGEGDISAASGFYNDLLSGNQAKEAQLLAPEISGIQKRGQQQIETAGEFGNRSGGTNASAQNNIDSQRSNVNDMVSQLTGQAAGNLGSLGTSTLGQGLDANKLNASEAQQRMGNQKNSILGQGITGAAELGEDFATGGSGGVESFFSGAGGGF